MTLSFEQARRRVETARRPKWEGPGEYMVQDYGYENATHFNIIDGPREFLVDMNPDYLVPNDVVTLVDKATGAISTTTYPISAEYLDNMTPVGDVPDDENESADA